MCHKKFKKNYRGSAGVKTTFGGGGCICGNTWGQRRKCTITNMLSKTFRHRPPLSKNWQLKFPGRLPKWWWQWLVLCWSQWTWWKKFLRIFWVFWKLWDKIYIAKRNSACLQCMSSAFDWSNSTCQPFFTSNWHFWQKAQMSDKCLWCKTEKAQISGQMQIICTGWDLCHNPSDLSST